jgi:hypothetical protein
MILNILLLVGGFMVLKKMTNAGNTTSTHTTSGARNAAGTTAVNLSVQSGTTQGAGSAKGNGNANQPWYVGAAVAGAGLGAAQIAKGLASLSSQSSPTGTPDEPTVDDSDLESAQSDMAASSASATADDEDAGSSSSSDSSDEGDESDA